MRERKACDGTGCVGGWNTCGCCKACEGSGQVEERITAADAVADAEAHAEHKRAADGDTMHDYEGASDALAAAIKAAEARKD